MHLSTIKLQGFKIFEHSTIVELDPKYTIITGLNGSGKSNIIDGILFVLGIESLKLLRVNNLKQLININSKSCTVSLKFSNIDPSKLKNTKFADLKNFIIKRTLDLNLKQKVYLNDSNISLNDLKTFLNLFNLFTGNKPSFIIQQGKVSQLLNDANSISNGETLLNEEVEKKIEKEVNEIKKRKISEIQELDDLTKDCISDDSDYMKDYDFKPMDLSFLDNTLNSKNRFISYLLEISGTKDFQNDKNSFINKLRKTEYKLLQVKNILNTQIVPHINELKKFKKYENNLKNYNEYKNIIKYIEIFIKKVELIKLIEEYNKLSCLFKNNEELKNIEDGENRIFLLENELKNLNIKINTLELKNSKYNNLEKQELENTEILKNEMKGYKNILLNEEFIDLEYEINQFLRINNLKLKINIENISESNFLKSLQINSEFINKFDFEFPKEKVIKLLNEFNNKINEIKNKCPYPLKEGVFGRVIENIEFDSKYEKAFNSVIGGRFNNLIVNTYETAKDILKEGNYTCIPLNRIKIKQKVKNSLINFCKYNLKYEKAFQFLLNDFMLQEDNNNTNKENVMSVNLEGTIYNPKGSLTGGAVLIHQKKEFINEFIKYTFLRNKLLNLLKNLTKDSLNELNNFIKDYKEEFINNELKIIENNINFSIEELETNILLSKTTKKILLIINRYLTTKKNSKLGIKEIEIKLKNINEKILKIETKNEKIELNNQIYDDNIIKYEENINKIEKYKLLINNKEEELKELKKYEFKDTKSILINENKMKKIEEKIEELLINKKSDEINFNLLEMYLNSHLSINYIHKDIEFNGKYSYLNGKLNINIEYENSFKTLKNYLNEKIIELSNKIENKFNKKNMDQLNLNKEKIKELNLKMKKLKKDSFNIFSSIIKLEKTSLIELTKTRSFINSNINKQINEFLPSLKVYITESNSLLISVDGKTYKSDFNQLSGGQKSIISLSLVFTGMKYNKSPLYVLDEVDAALDMSHTQFLGNIYKNMDVQFLVISLKNDKCNKLLRVVRKGGRSFVVEN